MLDLDKYLAAHRHRPGAIPTPVLVTVKGKARVKSLNAILYGPPPRETKESKTRRMADLIVNRVSASGNVTRDELLGGGFSTAEIDALFPDALARADLGRREIAS